FSDSVTTEWQILNTGLAATEGSNKLNMRYTDVLGGTSRDCLTIQSDGDIGIGNTSPDYPLDIAATQAVLRMTTSSNGFCTVLELGSKVASPTYIGAINFNNSANTYPGQIGYLGTNDMVFSVNGSERLRIKSTGETSVSVLEITGADVAEKFPVSETPEPGTV